MQLPDKPWATPAGKLVTRANVDRAAWLAARQSLIGASDVAAIFGQSRWADQFDVWADKTGRAPERPTTFAQARGLSFEASIIDLWAEFDAPFTVNHRRAGLVRSRQYPIIGATVDRLSVCDMDGETKRCVIEAKSQADLSEWGDDTDPEVPTAYQFQGSTQLIVTGRDHVHYVVMGPRWQILHRVIRRDPELEAAIVAGLVKWWADHVETDTPPIATHRSAATMRALYAADPDADALEVDDELGELLHRAANARKVRDEFTAAYADIEAQIQQAMGTATELRWPDGTLAATWRAGKTIDGANAAWRRQNEDVVERYSYDVTQLDVAKAVENEPRLVNGGGLRYRRTFTLKPIPHN